MDSTSRVYQQQLPSTEGKQDKSLPSAENGDTDAAMKEAYRNVAATLAASAWGDDDDHRHNSPGSFRNMGRLGHFETNGASSTMNYSNSPNSAFHLIVRRKEISSPDSDRTMESRLFEYKNKKDAYSTSIEELYNRSPKVAKASYADHGSHAEQSLSGDKNESKEQPSTLRRNGSSQDNILKTLIFSVEKTYHKIKHNEIKHHNKQEIKNSAPTYHQRNNRISNDFQPVSNNEQGAKIGNLHSKNLKQKPSGLQAALNSSTSSTTDNHTKKEKSKTRGKCLSSPPQPVSNNGLDNSEGNLIVHVNDILSVPKHMIHYQSSRLKSQCNEHSSRNTDTVDFQIIELLGQGTFAQVFKCKNLLTNEFMALKIVKSKPAYTRQAAIEIDIFKSLSTDLPVNFVREQQQRNQHQHQLRSREIGGQERFDSTNETGESSSNMVELLCYFLYHSHLCLAFELLGLNLYEVLKRRQFRGLSIRVVQSLVRQAMAGVKKLSQHSIVHCDLKPENILLVDNQTINSIINVDEYSDQDENERSEESHEKLRKAKAETHSHKFEEQYIKLIDFGSACFEGQTAHTYIQSRFYRSPEVLVGLPYDSAIDMWSLGCVAAELFLGLPILPGVHEHDQLCRICEMISPIPDWMIEQGSKSEKYFVRTQSPSSLHHGTNSSVDRENHASPKEAHSNWRLKTRQEHIAYMSEKERGNHEKLDQQPNRYFKRKRLSDIVTLHGHYCQSCDKETLRLFVHFLKGILDPDPWKRWTAHQASMHPFVTGVIPDSHRRSKEFYWVPPWDPSICHRKLLSVKKAREKKASLRHGSISRNSTLSGNSKAKKFMNSHTMDNGDRAHELSTQHSISGIDVPPESTATSRVTAMAESMSLSHALSSQGLSLPPGGTSFWGRESSPPPLSSFTNVPAILHHQYHSRIENPGNFPHQPFLPGSLNGSFHPQESRLYIHPRAPSNYSSNTSNFSNITPLGNSLVEAQYSPALMMSPTMQSLGRGYGDYPYHMPRLPTVTRPPNFSGPQSFSGVYYDRISQHLPIEGDLGYALQRPGVVPSMENDQSRVTYMPQHHLISTENLLSSHNNSNNFSGVTPGSMNMANSSHLSPGLHMSQAGSHQSHGQPQDRKDSRVESSSYKYEHDEKHVRINGTGHSANDNNFGTRSSLSSSGSRGKGLLAQQLEEHSAAMQEPKEASSENNHVHSNAQNNLQSNHHNQNHHMKPAFYRQHSIGGHESGSYGSTMQQHHGNYYTYAPSNGPPLILSSTAPSGADPTITPYLTNMGQYTGSHGSLHRALHSGKYIDVGGHSLPVPAQTHASSMDPRITIVDERTLLRSNQGFINNDNYVYLQPPPPYTDRKSSM